MTEEPFVAESGIRFLPDCQLPNAPSFDTLIVPGGWGLREPATCAAVSAWLRDRAPRTRRVATVCTGIYGLAPTGLLDGRSATTHWRFVEDARLCEARQRLIDTRKNIEGVAASLGFRSSDVFRRRFERHFGIAPRNYRERFTPSKTHVS